MAELNGGALSFVDYLVAKKSVDDRALNRQVWQTLLTHLPRRQPVRLLEVGMGIGTMLERLVAWGGVPKTAVYTGIDIAPANINMAQQRLQTSPILYELEVIDVFTFLAREQGERHWDVIIAHAFLDLVDVPAILPQLFALLAPDGLFYFTLNFDGATILQPTIDLQLDRQIESLYHQTMDHRGTNGRSMGDSQTGRHLFDHLRGAGGQILAAGSSDWVVFAGADGYPAAEADFLHFIIKTIHQALLGHPDLDATQFAEWIKQRHTQVAARELVYVAHQLDFVGRLQK